MRRVKNTAVWTVVLLWGFCCCCFLPNVRGTHVDDEKSLRTALLGSSYDSSIRPNTTTNVSLTLMALSLDDLDIGNQQMQFTFIFDIHWMDYRLEWDPASYSNIDTLVEPTESVWTPTFIVENGVSGKPGIPQTEDNRCPLRIASSGSVNWVVLLHTTTACEMTIAAFPFDTQRCSIIFTCWAYDTSLIHILSQSYFDLFFTENGEWELLSTSTSSGFWSGDRALKFDRVFFTFTFRRRWQFYAQNLVTPIVLTSLLMCMVFALPPETGEKLSYCVTVLLSYIVFLTWITDTLPAISFNVSILQVYVALVLCLGVLACLMTIWILSLYHRPQSRPMSKPMRLFVTQVLLPLQNFSRRAKTPPPGDDNVHEEDIDDHKPQQYQTSLPALSSKTNAVTPASDQQSGDKRLFSPRKKENGGGAHAHAQPEVTWQEVAAMMDRLMLFTFLVAISLLTVIIVGIMLARY